MVICLERCADLHMAQLMPLPLTVSCFSKIQIGFTFLVPAHQGSPGQRAVKRVCVCACGQVIMATNRIETLDPALIRPGRIDRKIEFPLPDEKTKRRIFSIHTNRMTLAEDVSLEDYVMAKDDLSGADIKVCTLLLSSLGGGWLGSRVVSVLHSGAEGLDSNRSCDAVR